MRDSVYIYSCIYVYTKMYNGHDQFLTMYIYYEFSFFSTGKKENSFPFIKKF